MEIGDTVEVKWIGEVTLINKEWNFLELKEHGPIGTEGAEIRVIKKRLKAVGETFKYGGEDWTIEAIVSGHYVGTHPAFDRPVLIPA